MISVATFDLAMLRSGWAVGSPGIADGSAKCGWGTFEPTPGDNKESATMARLRALLTDLHERYKLSNIVYESIFIDHSPNRHEYFGPEAQIQMSGVLHEFGGTHGIHVSKVPVATWRAVVYGTCKTPPQFRVSKKATSDYWKDKAIEWARARGYSPITWHDEAEALAILNWALSKLDHKFSAATGAVFRRAELQQMTKEFREDL